MINKYSFRYKLANFFAKNLLNNQTDQYFFSAKQRASCLIKVVFKYQDKILVGKKIQKDSVSKICLPYGYVDLANYADNISTCIQLAFDKMNLELDELDFDKDSLVDVKIDYEDGLAQLVYVYQYELTERDLSSISETHSLYDFFLLDLSELNEYNKKSRFVTNLDYIILKRLNG